MDSRSLVKLIVAGGWFLVGIKGSHHQYKHPTKKGRVTLPHRKRFTDCNS